MARLAEKHRGQLAFIARVLAEAERPDRTPAQRAMFLTIVERDLAELLTARCPCPEGDALAEVDALLARMDALACALVPPTICADDTSPWRVRVLRDERGAVGETKDVPGAVAACLAAREHAPVSVLACPQSMPEAAVREHLAVLDAPDAYVRRWPGDVPVSEQLLPLTQRLAPPETRDALPDADLFAAIRARDRLLIHPYDSYAPVIRLLQQAAADPAVETIAITLYRYEPDGPIIASLMDAAARGAHVTAVLEMRARGMEAASLKCLETLTGAGVRVVIPAGPRVHGKALRITRREDGVARAYAHFGTGNYHAGNARRYTDVSLLTADSALCADAARLFEAIEAGKTPRCERLSVSPGDLRTELLRLIRREMGHALAGRPCGIRGKVNALTDKPLIAALTEAARLGVPVDLTVRGACLMPGGGRVKIRSIVGLELEHARLCAFENGGSPEVYLSSADWMPRNLDRRHELLVPVTDSAAARRLTDWLALQARDTINAWLREEDDYAPLRERENLPIDAQALMRQGQ